MEQNNVLEKLIGPMSIGMLLRAHRLAHGLSFEQLEKKLKLPHGSLPKLEVGKIKLSLKETIKVAKKLEEFEDYWAMIWFQEEATNSGLDYHKYLKNHLD